MCRRGVEAKVVREHEPVDTAGKERGADWGGAGGKEPFEVQGTWDMRAATPGGRCPGGGAGQFPCAWSSWTRRAWQLQSTRGHEKEWDRRRLSRTRTQQCCTSPSRQQIAGGTLLKVQDWAESLRWLGRLGKIRMERRLGGAACMSRWPTVACKLTRRHAAIAQLKGNL